MSFPFTKMLLGLACMGLTMVTTQSFAKTYYKWVDSQGSTHYTTTPPPKTAKKRGKIDTYGWTNSPQPATTEAPPSSNVPNPTPAIPDAVPTVTPAAPVELKNQQRDANKALQKGQRAEPAI